MFEARINVAPKAASRPRYVPSFKRVVTPSDYREYKARLVAEFDKYADDPDLKDVLTNSLYGISLKVVYYFNGEYKGKYGSKMTSKVFHRQMPDLDNLVKATVDALFESKVNKKFVKYRVNAKGERVKVYKKIIDDSNIVHMDITKVNARKKDVGQHIWLSKALEEENV